MSAIVPAGLDALIDRMLRVGPHSGWQLLDWVARRGFIDARHRDRRGRLAFVRLYPREREVPVAHRRSERFCIALLRGEGEPLLDVLVEHLAAHEHAFAWQHEQAPSAPSPPPSSEILDPRELEAERISFERGIKPAIRQQIEREDAPWAATMFEREGAAVCVLDAELVPGRAQVFAARSPALALAACAAELAQVIRDPVAAAEGARELGRLLGYPACCVEAFVDDARTRRLQGPIYGVSKNWLRLDAAWVACPAPRINSLLFGEPLQLISFDPCRFDCPHALALADRIFAALAEQHPRACAELDRLLARPVLLAADDQRAWITLDDDRRITAVEPIRQGGGEDHESHLLAFVGGRVDAQGRIEGLPPPHRHRVFHFERGATRPDARSSS